jgi:FtsP/CotA-like multicopper oxidase with cupredoxin domain
MGLKRCTRALLTFLGALAALVHPAVSHAQFVSAYETKPTVTSTMGDRGGKYFGKAPDPSKTHHYYIAAETDQWNYMPLGSDPICGMTPPPGLVAQHVILKVRYFQYTDATFTTRVAQPSRLGILGPVLRGVVGDYLAITFLNRTALPLSMHPHGVKYDKDSEGSYYRDASQLKALEAGNPDARSAPGLGAAVGPSARFTYVWYLDERSGPLPTEPSSKGWLYHSHVGGEGEVNLGLEGFIIVTDPKRARPDGTPADVDREMPALFLIFNEGQLDPETLEHLAGANPAQALSKLGGAAANPQNPAPASGGASSPAAPNLAALKEEAERHTINGYIYGNLPGLEMNEGERVRWYLFGLGSESDFHSPHWHGLRVLDEGKRLTDTVELLPASMKVADLVADNPGAWLFHCHVADHMANGMFALVTVHPRDKSSSSQPAFLGLPPAAGTVGKIKGSGTAAN